MSLDRWNQHRQGRVARARLAAMEGPKDVEEYQLDASDVIVLRLAHRGHCGQPLSLSALVENAEDLGAVKLDSTVGWLLQIDFLRVAADGVSLTERGKKALRLFEVEVRDLNHQPRE
ncbi:MAG: hypothetical protein PW734_06745 [Verrucomicrobium sp.]|nr:hypothetical protein [Verrucomicrobium sp.]